MKTEVEMQRPFMGGHIRQKSKSQLFCSTDLIKIVNQKRKELNRHPFNFQQYLKGKSTQEFIKELQKENEKVIVSTKGRHGATWVHPYLLIDIALACDPKFKVNVYSWLYDQLLQYRNDSGDSYKSMCGHLYDNHNDKSRFHLWITKVAKYIKQICCVNNWDSANENQLKLRETIHDTIIDMSYVIKNNNQAVKLGCEIALKKFNDCSIRNFK